MKWSDFNYPTLKNHEVRLFPTAGIKSEKEAEMRATAALLAMVRAVAEFGGAIIKEAGGPGGKTRNVQCYTEVSFLPDFPEDNYPARPDGIIRRIIGKNSWAALVEVKIGSNDIDEKQIDNYLKWAKSLDFDALITISNQITKPNGDAPYDYNHKIKKVKVKHFSWEKIHTIVQDLCGQEKRIEDVDQQWMLEQFNKYLADENSGIIAPPTLSESWHEFLKNVKANNLKVHQDKVEDVVKHWIAFLRIASFKIGAKIGQDVKIGIPNKFKNDPAGLIKTESKKAIDYHILEGQIKFPGMDYIKLRINLDNKELLLSHKIYAPEDGRRDTRVNWIIRELKRHGDIPFNLRIKIDWKKYGLISSAKYKELTDGIVPLLREKGGAQIGKDVMPRWFLLEQEFELRGKRGTGSTQELKGILNDLENFYRLVQPIERPFEKPRQLQKEEESLVEETEVRVIDSEETHV